MNSKFHKIKASISMFFYKKNGQYSNYNYYQNRLRDSKGELFYKNLIDDEEKNKGIKTDIEISHGNNKPISKLIKKDIIKIFGKPNHQINIQNSIETSVFFYKQNIGNHSVKIEFHFYKSNLIFYVYTFSNPKKNNEIIKVIKEKRD